MTRNRLNMVLAVLAMVVVAAAGFFLGVQPQLSRAATDGSQQATVEHENAVKSGELARLRQRAEALPEMRTALAELQASVPSSDRMSAFYDEIDQAATTAGVTVSTITTSDATAYIPPVTEAAPTATDGTEPTAAATPTSTPSASATPSAPGVTTDAQITGENFSVIPVTVSVDGSFDQAMSFATEVQDLSRLYLVTSITSSASEPSAESTETSSTTWNFSGYVYVLDVDADASGTTEPPGDAG
jgi:Tfp pilus assembly protein PilO